MRGWLDADGYASAWRERRDDDPFFHPSFLAAGAIADEGEVAAFAHGDVLYPFVVRPLAGGRCDLTSPYGYGGPLGAGEWRAAFRAACAERRVVSEFVRFHPLRRNHAGLDELHPRPVLELVTLDVRADDEELVRRMVPTARQKLRKAQRRGIGVVESGDLERFLRIYGETMDRRGASGFYRFPRAYFEALEGLGESLLLLDAGEAAALFLLGGGAMHYFLAGATDEGRRVAATNLLLFEAMRRARERGLAVLNLGGGLEDGDSLHTFKASLGPGRTPYRIGSAVHDAGAYAELAGDADAGDFFPAYRAGGRLLGAAG